MLQKIVCFLVAGWLCLLSFPYLANGQDNLPATENAVNDVSDLGTNFVKTMRRAVDGKEDAREALLEQFLVPAALALILMIVGYLFASFMGRVVGGTVSKRVDKTIGRFSGKVVHHTIMVMVLLGALGYFGIDVTSFAAILAAAGFAIGMALQGTLANFAAGVMLLVFRPFQIDDYINVADTEGSVEEIDLFTTKLNTPDNRHLIIPNSKIFGETMINFSRNSTRRVDVSVGVSYDADIRRTRRTLEKAIENVHGVLPSPEPQVVLVELGDSALAWQCRVWSQTENYWVVRELLTEQIKYSLDEAQIGIPFPQMDVNVAGKLFAKAA